MRYELMFPEQIRKAIDENWPVVLSLGVLEYHAEHCCVGVDTLLVVRAVEELEKEISDCLSWAGNVRDLWVPVLAQRFQAKGKTKLNAEEKKILSQKGQSFSKLMERLREAWDV